MFICPVCIAYFFGRGFSCLNDSCFVAGVGLKTAQDVRLPARKQQSKRDAIKRYMLFIEESFRNKRI
jgi:hypothetical protein